MLHPPRGPFLLGDGMAPALAAAIDPEQIDAVGLSMGGTAIYGLLGVECCVGHR